MRALHMECVSRVEDGEYHARETNDEGQIATTCCGKELDTSDPGTRIHRTATVARQMATREGKKPCRDCLAELGPTASEYFIPEDSP